MKSILLGVIAMFLLQIGNAQQKMDAPVFIAPPYLQIGTHPTAQSLELMWHVGDEDADWQVEYQTVKAVSWITGSVPTFVKVAVAGITAHRVYKTTFDKLTSSSSFNYRVLKNKQVVFTATGQAPKNSGQAFRCVVFGDIGAGTPEAIQIAKGVYAAKPDMVVVPGDIVYDNGLVSEYRSRFWPIYNAEKLDSVGGPLMRSFPFVGNVGNHDLETRDLDKHPDALAYYYYWAQPLNGADVKEGGAMVPMLKGSDANKKAFMDAAGAAYPKMANFSFDYGNAHWLMLDADNYVDWTDKALQDYVAKDLADAKNTVWKFVVFHHPGFNSSHEHFEQQQMRMLAPVFEKGGVDVVFNGHVHNYQRSFPLTFVPDNKGIPLMGGKDGKSPRGRLVVGQWTLDKAFDGKTNTHPKGIIYLVTGAGGQDLYNPEQEATPDTWQKFTSKFVSTVHTFTVADVKAKTLTINQTDAEGKVRDSFTITK